MSFFESFADWAQLAPSSRWSLVVDVLCLLGLVAALAASRAHFRASTRKLPLAGAGRLVAALPTWCLALAAACMGVCVTQRGYEVNHFPSQTMSEVLQMFSLALLVSMIVLHFALGMQRRGNGWAILDDVLIGLVFLGVFWTHLHIATLSTAQRDLPPALQSYWFPPHLASLIFSYATMAVAAGVALYFFVTRFWTAMLAKEASASARRAQLATFLGLALVLDGALAWALSAALDLPFVPCAVFAGLPAGIVAWSIVRFALERALGGPVARLELLILLGAAFVPFVQVVTVPLLLVSGLVFGVLKLANRVPDLAAMVGFEKELDDVSFRAFAVGIPFLTAGLWMGAFWAQEAWANYWGWDSKENAALITWLVYIVYIHLRMLGGYRGSRAMAVLVGGALSVFVTFQLFGYFPDSQKSLHRYTDDNVRPMEGQQSPGPANEQARIEGSERR
jgi:cytochrome c-type biogenesis protein CcsB